MRGVRETKERLRCRAKKRHFGDRFVFPDGSKTECEETREKKERRRTIVTASDDEIAGGLTMMALICKESCGDMDDPLTHTHACTRSFSLSFCPFCSSYDVHAYSARRTQNPARKQRSTRRSKSNKKKTARGGSGAPARCSEIQHMQVVLDLCWCRTGTCRC